MRNVSGRTTLHVRLVNDDRCSHRCALCDAPAAPHPALLPEPPYLAAYLSRSGLPLHPRLTTWLLRTCTPVPAVVLLLLYHGYLGYAAPHALAGCRTGLLRSTLRDTHCYYAADAAAHRLGPLPRLPHTTTPPHLVPPPLPLPPHPTPLTFPTTTTAATTLTHITTATAPRYLATCHFPHAPAIPHLLPHYHHHYLPCGVVAVAGVSVLAHNARLAPLR